MPDIQPFQINGWNIRQCTDGFDVVHGDELYHEPSLEHAVRMAQRSHRETPKEES